MYELWIDIASEGWRLLCILLLRHNQMSTDADRNKPLLLDAMTRLELMVRSEYGSARHLLIHASVRNCATLLRRIRLYIA